VPDRLLQVIEAVPARVAVFDREMRYLLVSKRWLVDYKLEQADLIGRTHYEVFPDLPARWKEVHQRCLQGAIEYSNEDRFERGNGTVDWSRWEVRPWREVSGQIGGIIISAEDISARKNTELALRESEARFKLLHRLAVAAVDIQSEAELVRAVLDGALEVTRAPKGNVLVYEERANVMRFAAHHGLSQGFLDYFKELVVDDEAAWVRRLRSSERITAEDVGKSELFAPTLRAFEAEGIRAVQSTPIVSRQGRLLGVISTYWPHLHRLDEATLLTLDLLARDVADRMQRLRDEHAWRDADRRKDQFLAMLAHELRNPLAAIKAAVEVVRRHGDPAPPVHRASAIMGRQIKQLVRMVDELLEVSRITSGKLTMKKERTYLASVVNTAVETCLPLIEGKGLTLEVAVPTEPVAFDSDPARLAQALVNLLTNAAKYTPAGGKVSITATHEQGLIFFRVRDTGIGIALDMLEPIFDLFVQATHSLDRSQGGLGLGLPLVRSIIELHGGKVAAFSDGVSGSEFVIRLPVTSTLNESPAVKPIAPHRSRRILVVEDNHDVAEGIANLLTGAGHEVHVAHDGQAGLELAERGLPEMVLIDIGLPILDGYEVARRLRKLAGLERTLIVALSGYGDAKDRELSRRAGFDHHLVKPADIDKIEGLLATLA
jgi:PAS domain S-box-containing protein